MLQKLPATGFREGRWLNGMGVSWDIAAEPPGASMNDFGWRFAIARIDADVPFSRYPDVDRVFTLIDGDGLALDVTGQGRLDVGQRFRPWRFAGDAETQCTLNGGPCRALNLFLRRGRWRADVTVTSGASVIGDCDTGLVFALRGDFAISGQSLQEGDAAFLQGTASVESASGEALLYAARLFRVG